MLGVIYPTDWNRVDVSAKLWEAGTLPPSSDSSASSHDISKIELFRNGFEKLRNMAIPAVEGGGQK